MRKLSLFFPLLILEMEDFLRIWMKLDLEEIKNHLLVVGELSGECFSCHKVGIKIGEKKCPQCKKEFKYIGFRRKADAFLVRKFKKLYSEAEFIDFGDFKKAFSKKEVKRILNF